MSYSKKRRVSYIAVFVCVAAALLCRHVKKTSDIENIILDQSRTCLYLGLYIAWGIYLQKRVVNSKIRRCLVEIASLMVFWIFLRSIKYHILMEVFSRRMCWYLYYIPCTMIPTLGLNAAILMGEEEEKNTRVRTLALVLPAILLALLVITNDFHQLVFSFPGEKPFSDAEYQYGAIFFAVQIWAIFCLIAMEAILTKKSKIPNKRRIWLPFFPGALLLIWNFGNVIGISVIRNYFGDMAVVCCLLMSAIYQSCIYCGLIETNTRYTELFQAAGGISAEITDDRWKVWYRSGEFPNITDQMRHDAKYAPLMLEHGIQIKHISLRGGHAFWAEDISPVLDQYKELEELQVELTERNRLLQIAYEKEAEKKAVEEKNRLFNLIQNQTKHQIHLLDYYLDELQKTDSEEIYDKLLRKIVVVGTYMKRRKNLILSQKEKQAKLTAEDLKRSLTESCDSLKLCDIKGTFYIDPTIKSLGDDSILTCYDFFEWVIEELIDELQSVFLRIAEIDGQLKIAVTVKGPGNLSVLLKKNPGLYMEQEAEDEWFVSLKV